MNMTLEEKYKKALDFIEYVSKLHIPIDPNLDQGRFQVVDIEFINELKEKAWHLYADLA